MPTHLHDGALGYLRGLFSRIARANCVRIAERAGRGHDSITGMLSKGTIDAEGYIATTLIEVFVTLNIGSIIIDDTAVNKEFAKAIEGCSWVWSSAKERTLFMGTTLSRSVGRTAGGWYRSRGASTRKRADKPRSTSRSSCWHTLRNGST